jgi:hypothetical protein
MVQITFNVSWGMERSDGVSYLISRSLSLCVCMCVCVCVCVCVRVRVRVRVRVCLLFAWVFFCPGSNRGSVRVQGEVDFGGDGNAREYTIIPPGIKWAMAQCNVHGIGGTGRMRFFQSSFDVNEMIAALGHVVPAMDPFTGAPCKFLMPLSKDTLNEKYE